MKNLKESLKENVTLYWWNLGTKKLDFKGTYDDWLKSRDVKVRNTKNGIVFKFRLSQSTVTMTCTHPDPTDALDECIQNFLTHLGDKALFYGKYNREFKINWR